MVSAGSIVLHLDSPSDNDSTMESFRILGNHIVHTKYISGNHASAIRLGTGDNSQATIGANEIYKDSGSSYDFGDWKQSFLAIVLPLPILNSIIPT